MVLKSLILNIQKEYACYLKIFDPNLTAVLDFKPVIDDRFILYLPEMSREKFSAKYPSSVLIKHKEYDSDLTDKRTILLLVQEVRPITKEAFKTFMAIKNAKHFWDLILAYTLTGKAVYINRRTTPSLDAIIKHLVLSIGTHEEMMRIELQKLQHYNHHEAFYSFLKLLIKNLCAIPYISSTNSVSKGNRISEKVSSLQHLQQSIDIYLAGACRREDLESLFMTLNESFFCKV